jgi:hypothetical protein
VRIEGREIRYLKDAPPRTGLWAELTSPPCNAATFFHAPSGAQLSFQGDRAPSKVVFYGVDKAVCIEPFIVIELQPGESLTWSTRYELKVSS